MKVCVFGAGNMGARITEVFLNAGHDVTMIDIKPEFTERGKTVIAHDYDFLVKKGKMTEEHKDELLAALKTTVDRNAAADADFVMEVILERMDLKKDLLEDLDKICIFLALLPFVFWRHPGRRRGFLLFPLRLADSTLSVKKGL